MRGTKPNKDLDPSSYRWKADDNFFDWLWANPTPKYEETLYIHTYIYLYIYIHTFVHMMDFTKKTFNDKSLDIGGWYHFRGCVQCESGWYNYWGIWITIWHKNIYPPFWLVKNPTGTIVISKNLQEVEDCNLIPNEHICPAYMKNFHQINMNQNAC